jgi:hypothetical protein
MGIYFENTATCTELSFARVMNIFILSSCFNLESRFYIDIYLLCVSAISHKLTPSYVKMAMEGRGFDRKVIIVLC